MRIFIYKAIDEKCKIVHGEVSALDAEKAANSLKAKGFLIKKLGEKKQKTSSKKGVNRDDFVQFITEFIALIKAGLTVTDSLEQSKKRPENPGLASALDASLIAIREGAPLSEALGRYPGIFDDMLIAAVKTGESSGNLAGPLEKYKSYLDRSNTIRKKITQALVYPAFILSVMVIILAVLFIFVMPRFTALYADNDAELPGPTKAVFFIVMNMKFIAPPAALAVFLLAAAVFYLGKKPSIKMAADKFFFNMVFIGKIAAPLQYSSTARSIATLLSGGMPLADSLKTAANGTRNIYFRGKLEKVISRIYGGEHFAAAAGAENLMPETAIKLFEAGESSGSLDAMLSEVANYYDQVADGRISAAMSIMEPLLIFITGIVVGGVVIIMYLPVFKLTEIIK
jgi:type IV pilus assembly protein PilC